MRRILRVVGWLALAGCLVLGGFVGWVFLNRNVNRMTLIDDWFDDPSPILIGW